VKRQEPAVLSLDLDDLCNRREGIVGRREPDAVAVWQIVSPSSTGMLMKVMPRASASDVAAGASSVMNSATDNRSRFSMPSVSLTSASE
jgi:hypothetical protein